MKPVAEHGEVLTVMMQAEKKDLDRKTESLKRIECWRMIKEVWREIKPALLLAQIYLYFFNMEKKR